MPHDLTLPKVFRQGRVFFHEPAPGRPNLALVQPCFWVTPLVKQFDYVILDRKEVQMARPQKHGKPWTKQEIASLKDQYHSGTLHRVIAAKLKRTLVAVESKAMELNLSSRRKRR
jgi:hypothetical protein